MRKIALGALVVLVLVALAFPLANLFGGPPQVSLPGARDPAHPEIEAALARSCADCHTRDAKKPFYASLPVAGSTVQADIDRARRFFDMGRKLAAPPDEVTLARIELALLAGDMPPGRYLALHWNAGVGDARERILAWTRATRAAQAAPDVPETLRAAILQPLPEKVAADPVKVDLGRRLYHDTRLSGDGTLSCASCHGLDKGGTDQARVSTGIRGQKGGINAPTVYNAVFAVRQFWDGRAADLKAQAAGPVANPVEMGAQWPEVITRLKADTAFAEEFGKAWPQGLGEDTVTEAIAAFEATLVTPGSPFDRHLLGDDKALGPAEREGLEAFGRLGCSGCHVGRALGGRSFERMGLAADYFADRGTPTPADEGRFAVTRDEADRHHFKVPMLRNVALTHPYFHDGSATTLEAAVETMVHYQTGEGASEPQKKALVAFLRSLTGTYQGKAL